MLQTPQAHYTVERYFHFHCLRGLRRLDAVTSIGGCELNDMKKTVEQLQLDPNDPQNASIMQLLKVGATTNSCSNISTILENSTCSFFVTKTFFPCICGSPGGQRWRGARSGVLPTGEATGGVLLCDRWSVGATIANAQAQEAKCCKVWRLQMCSWSRERGPW